MRRGSRNGGFTLLELVVASGLTAVLMACVLSVLSTLAKDRRRAGTRGGDASAVVELIRLDLVHARRLRGDAAGARQTLVGPLAIDPVRLTPTGRVAEVTYEVVAPLGVDASHPVRPGGAATTHGGSWLVRRQRVLDDPRAAGATWSELVATGVSSLALTPEPASPITGTTAAEAARPTLGGENGNVNGASALSGRVRVRLTWLDPKRPPIDVVAVSW